jgi:uncharacterized protein DUF6687
MEFKFYDDRFGGEPFLCVDGVVEGGLNLSHWPGNRTPARFKADTSTEMALNLARHPGRAEWLRGVSIVTNNHFDTDGLLSVYACLEPEEALRHEKEMIRAARTGDFGEFNTPEAFKFDAVVSAFDDDRLSPVASELRGRGESERHQILYDRLLALMPGLLSDASRYKEIWAEPLASLLRSLMRIKDVTRVREHADARLTVIEALEPIDAMARWNVAGHHRVLTATRSDRGPLYEMAFQVFTWFETVTPPRGTRVDLSGVAGELDRMERSPGGRWIYTGNDSLEARLYRAAPDGAEFPSSLPLEEIERHLVRFFGGRP